MAKLTLRLPNTTSLKDKRRLIKSLIAKSRQDQHAAVSEVDQMDNFRAAVIGISLVSNDPKMNERILQQIVGSIDHHPEIELIGEEIEAFSI